MRRELGEERKMTTEHMVTKVDLEGGEGGAPSWERHEFIRHYGAHLASGEDGLQQQTAVEPPSREQASWKYVP